MGNVDWIDLAQDGHFVNTVMNEPSCSITCGEFLD
jgi:hypothetical protein